MAGKMVYGSITQDPNTLLIARMISQMGDDVAGSIQRRIQQGQKEKEFKVESFKALAEFSKLDPEERQRILAAPGGIKMVTDLLDPHLYGKHSDKKEGAGPSYEGVLGMGAESPMEGVVRRTKEENLKKAGFEAGKSQAEFGQKLTEIQRQSDFYDLAKKYDETGDDSLVTPLIHAGVQAGIPGILEHPDMLLHGGAQAMLKEKEQKVVGSEAWNKAETQKQIEALTEKYPITNQKEMDAVRSLAAGTVDGKTPIDWTGLPKSWKQYEEVFKNKQLGVQQSAEQRLQVAQKADLYKYFSQNGIPEDKLALTVDTFAKSGKMPSGVLFPADKKGELDLKLKDQQFELGKLQISHETANDPAFRQIGDMYRDAISAKNKQGIAKYGKMLDDAFFRIHPDLKGKPVPGWWDKVKELIGAGGNLAQGAAGMAGAVGSDAASAMQAGHEGSVWPLGRDVLTAGQGLASAVTPAAQYIDAAAKEATAGAGNAVLGAAGYAIPGAGGIVDKIRQSFGTLQQGMQQNATPIGTVPQMPNVFTAPGTPSAPATPPAGTMPESPELSALRDKVQSKLEEVSNMPNLSYQEKQYYLGVAQALQAAEGDPTKMMQLISQLGIK